MERIAVFAYGSLVDPASASRTLGRPVTDAIPARLSGWARRWSEVRDNRGCEKTFARVADRSVPDHVLGLNVERSGDGLPGPNGILIPVGERELERLDARELRYERVEVTGQLVATEGPGAAHERFDRAVAYVARQSHFAPEPPADAVVLASYVRAVEAAFAALGEEQLRLYRETSDPPPVEVVEAILVRDRIPPGNPREW